MTPVFIIGAPRSGSTFLTTCLNRHPQAFITNELRAWSVIAQTASRLESPSELLPEHPLRDAYAASVVTAMVDNLRQFYSFNINKSNLGCPTKQDQHYFRRIGVFGDKNPGYSDPNNVGCLSSITQFLPDSKFIHVFRDPRSCVASYLNVAVYANDVETVSRMWCRHVDTALSHQSRVGDDRLFSVRYEDWVSEAGANISEDLIQFLGLDPSDEIKLFLDSERQNPTPYRSPITLKEDLGKTQFVDRLSREQIAIVEDICEGFMDRLGYKPFVFA